MLAHQQYKLLCLIGWVLISPIAYGALQSPIIEGAVPTSNDEEDMEQIEEPSKTTVQKPPKSTSWFLGGGVLQTHLRDASNPSTPLKGESKGGSGFVGYQFTPRFSAYFTFIRTVLKEKACNNSFSVKAANASIAGALSYQITHWLNIELGQRYMRGKFTMTTPGAINEKASTNISGSISNLGLKMKLLTQHHVGFFPEIKFYHMRNTNGSYNDNNGILQPTSSPRLNQVTLGSRVIFNKYAAYITPYVHANYMRTLYRKGLSVRSNEGYGGGVGMFLFSGLLNIDWTTNRLYGSITTHSWHAGLNIRL